MAVSANAWLLAAIAVPLTIVTIATWWIWTNCNIAARPKFLQALSPPKFRLPKFQFHPRSQYFAREREKQRLRNLVDLETGTSARFAISPQSTLYQPEISPQTLCDSRQGTWQTMSSSVKV